MGPCQSLRPGWVGYMADEGFAGQGKRWGSASPGGCLIPVGPDHLFSPSDDDLREGHRELVM